ncbi:hypothetical protein, partial [Salmonella sp. s57936]|uniref:hypothetical protein n=1 Tax=Salmonella sp. s57936 TaxID=3159698 RepID=UPI00397F738D
MTATGAVHASAAGAALAAIILSSWSLHDNSIEVALIGLDEIDTIAVSFLHALAGVSAIAVSALVRHGEEIRKEEGLSFESVF